MKHWMLWLACFNAADGFLTWAGLRGGWMEEANPLLQALSPSSLLGIKLLLSVFLAALAFSSFSCWFTRRFARLAQAACFLYVLVLSLHGFWLLPLMHAFLLQL